MSKAVAITTVDNPFNPFEDFSSWFKYDVTKGYNTTSALALIAKTSETLSDEENNAELERAIDQMIRFDSQNRYIKVHEGDKIVSKPLDNESEEA